jgi:hypothetical protein
LRLQEEEQKNGEVSPPLPPQRVKNDFIILVEKLKEAIKEKSGWRRKIQEPLVR